MKEKLRNTADWILLVIIPALVFYSTEYMIFNISDNIKLSMQIVNIVFFEIMAWLLIAVTGRVKAALRIEIVFFWFFALADAYVFIFRDSYIQPWDLFSFGTAMNVAGNYDYTPNTRMIIGTLCCVGLFVLTFFCNVDAKKIFKKTVLRIVTGIVALAAFAGLATGLQDTKFCKMIGFHEGKFRLYVTTQYNGYVMGFLNKMKYMSVEKPSGYSAAEEKKLLDETEPDMSGAEEEYPDIVVVMNEAFSDPKVDGNFTTNVDYMPFIHSLQDGGENSITGYVNVSVNGGNTPNSEFEFLTGNSMAFLPDGSIAYQSYVNKDIDALPWYLASLGYETIGMHDYESSGWNRENVYPHLGFDEIHFQDYFYQFNPTIVRDYISDKSLFDQIEYELDNRENPDSPVFSFSVTMQNHSGYDGDPENFERTVFVDGLDDLEDKYVKRLNNYLSLVKLSDEALQEFTEKLEKSDRKTIVVMFGDHQPSPSVLRKIYELNGNDYQELDEEANENIYRVPFVIWANYDIEEEHGVETSLNYLGNYMLRAAGIPLTKYRTLADKISDNIPILSAIRVVDKNGSSGSVEDNADKVIDYRKLQYYELFDDKDDYK